MTSAEAQQWQAEATPYAEQLYAQIWDADIAAARVEGFTPRAIMDWHLGKNDYVLRLARGEVVERDAHWAARRALSDALAERKSLELLESD